MNNRTEISDCDVPRSVPCPSGLRWLAGAGEGRLTAPIESRCRWCTAWFNNGVAVLVIGSYIWSGRDSRDRNKKRIRTNFAGIWRFILLCFFSCQNKALHTVACCSLTSFWSFELAAIEHKVETRSWRSQRAHETEGERWSGEGGAEAAA